MFIQLSLVFMLNKQMFELKLPLIASELKDEGGNSNIHKKDHKTVILNPVSCFYSKCPSNALFLRIASLLVRGLPWIREAQTVLLL